MLMFYYAVVFWPVFFPDFSLHLVGSDQIIQHRCNISFKKSWTKMYMKFSVTPLSFK